MNKQNNTPGYNIRKMKEAFIEDLEELLDNFRELSGLSINGIRLITMKSFGNNPEVNVNLLGVDVEEV